jgi:Flp pilus assembly protein TadD
LQPRCLLIRQGAHETGLEHASRAAALMPDLAEAHLNRGIGFARGHSYAEAEAALRRALALKPDSLPASSAGFWLGWGG